MDMDVDADAWRRLSLDFRRRQFSEPSAVSTAAENAAQKPTEHLPSTSTSTTTRRLVPADVKQDLSRVILHFDLDAFYAQVEAILDPTLAGKPLAVYQKYLIVTCSYEARQFGITKLMNTKEAVRKCPGLILRCGEDLTPYRAASRKAEKHLTEYGVVERLGMDEFYVDVTSLVNKRLEQSGEPRNFKGNLFSMADDVRADTTHRPQDLRSATKASSLIDPPVEAGGGKEETLRIAVGSHIASDARETLKLRHGFKASCGISVNKLISKLIGGLHKPDNQTAMHFRDAAEFMASLPVRVIKGIGAVAEQKLKRIGVTTCLEMRSRKLHEISKHVTKSLDLAKQFHRNSWGIDLCSVEPKGPPKSVTVEDSFKSLCGYSVLEKVLREVLIPDLIHRLNEDYQDFCRKPKTLSVTFRTTKMRERKHFARRTLSGPFPSKLSEVLAEAMSLLRKGLGHEQFTLTLLNVGATNFARVQRSLLDLDCVKEEEAVEREEGGSVWGNPLKKMKLDVAKELAEELNKARRNYGHSPGRTFKSKHEARVLASTGAITDKVVVASSGAAPVGVGMYFCKICKKEIDETRRVEHDDFHLAEQIHKSEFAVLKLPSNKKLNDSSGKGKVRMNTISSLFNAAAASKNAKRTM